ncbi:MAG: RNA methyltransferase [Planctomycetales bacterium]
MPLIHLTDLTDPRLEVYRNLKDTNLTRWKGLFVAEGEKLVRRLLDSDYEPVSILAGETYVDRLRDILPPDLPVYVIPTRAIDDLVGFQFHRGLLACGRRKSPLVLDDILPPENTPWTCVVCPDVTDPENLGAIIRISAAFGVHAVLLGPRCGDPFSRRILRVSMGTTFKLPIVQSADLPSDLKRLQAAGVQLAATILDPLASPLHDYRRPRQLALMFGNEGDGLPPEIIATADVKITIPMQNGTDSLNVSVAAGVFLYHCTR